MKAKGRFKIKKDSIKIITSKDFVDYYRWFFDRAHWHTIKTQTPMHGAHINVVSPKFYKRDCSKYLHLQNKDVEFYYDVKGHYGGHTKGFLNFWFTVRCAPAQLILDDLQINNHSLHLTVLNNKNL